MNWPPITTIDAAPARSSSDGAWDRTDQPPQSEWEPDRSVGRGSRLSVVGPARFRQPLESTMTEVGVTVDFSLARMGESDGSQSSSRRIEQAIADSDADAALVVIPRKLSIADAVSAPVIDGVPTGIVPADGMGDLRPFLRAIRSLPRSEWMLFAMGKDRYLSSGATILDRARRAETDNDRGFTVRDRRADRCSRSDACQAISEGPRLAMYLGHAQPNGWSGYQTLRWSHLSSFHQRAPIGAIVHLACETMATTPSGRPFGVKFVETGRAAASLGCTGSISENAVSQLASVIGECLEAGEVETIGDMVIALTRAIEREPVLDSTLVSRFRLVGFPLQSIR